MADSRSPKAVAGFVSLTEVGAGEHSSYNRWHLYDHLPEQLPLRGIVYGERWVLTPSLRLFASASAPLDRVHYATLYLLAAPLVETLDDFRSLAAGLRAAGRFHQARTSHLSGPMSVVEALASSRSEVSAPAVPYRPCSGIHVRIDDPEDASELVECEGVVGTWSFAGDEAAGTYRTRGVRMTLSWLDGDIEETAAAIAGSHPAPSGARFVATLARVDPHGSWDWFD